MSLFAIAIKTKQTASKRRAFLNSLYNQVTTCIALLQCCNNSKSVRYCVATGCKRQVQSGCRFRVLQWLSKLWVHVGLYSNCVGGFYCIIKYCCSPIYCQPSHYSRNLHSMLLEELSSLPTSYKSICRYRCETVFSLVKIVKVTKGDFTRNTLRKVT